MMDRSFVESIKDLAEVKTLEIDGRPYTTKQVYSVQEPDIAPMAGHTLQGLVDFIDVGIVDFNYVDMFVQVFSPTEVYLYKRALDEWNGRDCLFKASAYDAEQHFGQWLEAERFIVYLQACFEQTDVTANILQLVSSIREVNERGTDDNGVTQTVTAKTGVVQVGTVVVPNPVVLAPFRTFPDIAQPASKFVFRVKTGRETPLCAIYEADGGAWRNAAIETIKAWLKDKLPSEVLVTA